MEGLALLLDRLKLQDKLENDLELEFQGLNKGRVYRQRLEAIKSRRTYLTKKIRNYGLNQPAFKVLGVFVKDNIYHTFEVIYYNVLESDIPLLLNRDIKGYTTFQVFPISTGIPTIMIYNSKNQRN